MPVKTAVISEPSLLIVFCAATFRAITTKVAQNMYTPVTRIYLKQKIPQLRRGFFILCAPNRARTGDLLIKSQMLYQLSYGCGVKLRNFVSLSKSFYAVSAPIMIFFDFYPLF